MGVRLAVGSGGGVAGTAAAAVAAAVAVAEVEAAPAASRARKAPSSPIVLISGAGKTTVVFLSTPIARVHRCH
jgi:hypothetical protein